MNTIKEFLKELESIILNNYLIWKEPLIIRYENSIELIWSFNENKLILQYDLIQNDFDYLYITDVKFNNGKYNKDKFIELWKGLV